MITPDEINAVFECFALFVLIGNTRQLYKDKQVRGISWPPFALYAVWGFWNMFFYPFVGQWISMYVGLLVLIANMTNLGMILFYIRKERLETKFESNIV